MNVPIKIPQKIIAYQTKQNRLQLLIYSNDASMHANWHIKHKMLYAKQKQKNLCKMPNN